MKEDKFAISRRCISLILFEMIALYWDTMMGIHVQIKSHVESDRNQVIMDYLGIY